jgi:UDP-N-acetylglucosamine--N-acetylmuramyl-(pentapeptide) pyrophosphoryl-undecaprenol N-acetylglucosamine transferase
LGLAPDRPTVLVVGGSQGALAVNLAVDAALAGGLWPAGVQLIWQTGAGTYDRFAGRDAPGRVVVRPFLDPVAEAYAAADLMVARAGAMTIAELCAWGLPAILIPLPTAAAGHQLTNARALADANAALLLEQRFATGTKLSETIVSLLSCPARMADIASAVRGRAHPDAADVIAASALRVLSPA